MKTNTNKQREIYGKYILDNFDEEYGTPATLGEACRLILDTYDSQGMNDGYNRKRHPNYQERVADWMMALPSPWHPDFENYKIEQILREWGVIKEGDDEKQIAKLVNGWFKWWGNFLIVNSK